MSAPDLSPLVVPWRLALRRRPLYFLRRFLFSRCARCGRGFRFGEVPLRLGGAGGVLVGPSWFKSESSVYHRPCLLRPRLATWAELHARTLP